MFYNFAFAETYKITSRKSLATHHSIPSRRSCDDHYRAGVRNDGVYELIVNQRVFTAFCEFPNDGHGWMVIF